MPAAAPRFCTAPGCGVLVQGGSRCAAHVIVRRGNTNPARLRGRKWMAIRARVLRAEPRCVECLAHGRLKAADEVDHRMALEDSGTDELDNLQGLCHECHAAKTAREKRDRAR